MKPMPNYNFSSIKPTDEALSEIEKQIHVLINIIRECDDNFTEQDRTQLVENISWLKRFYEAAERTLL